MMATAAKPAAPRAAPVPATVKPNPTAQLQVVRGELANLLQKDVSELGGALDADHPYSQYVKDNALTLKFDTKEDRITVTKSILGYK